MKRAAITDNHKDRSARLSKISPFLEVLLSYLSRLPSTKSKNNDRSIKKIFNYARKDMEMIKYFLTAGLFLILLFYYPAHFLNQNVFFFLVKT